MCRVLRMAKERFWDEPIETGPIPDSGSEFDCIVVGGGPGGSAAASYLAMEGKTYCLSKKAFGLETRYVETLLVGNR